jgi:hypothetical protein
VVGTCWRVRGAGECHVRASHVGVGAGVEANWRRLVGYRANGKEGVLGAAGALWLEEWHEKLERCHQHKSARVQSTAGEVQSIGVQGGGTPSRTPTAKRTQANYLPPPHAGSRRARSGMAFHVATEARQASLLEEPKALEEEAAKEKTANLEPLGRAAYHYRGAVVLTAEGWEKLVGAVQKLGRINQEELSAEASVEQSAAYEALSQVVEEHAAAAATSPAVLALERVFNWLGLGDEGPEASLYESSEVEVSKEVAQLLEEVRLAARSLGGLHEPEEEEPAPDSSGKKRAKPSATSPAAAEAPGKRKRGKQAKESTEEAADVPLLKAADFEKGWAGACYVCGMPASGTTVAKDLLGEAHTGCLTELPPRLVKKRTALLVEVQKAEAQKGNEKPHTAPGESEEQEEICGQRHPAGVLRCTLQPKHAGWHRSGTGDDAENWSAPEKRCEARHPRRPHKQCQRPANHEGNHADGVRGWRPTMQERAEMDAARKDGEDTGAHGDYGGERREVHEADAEEAPAPQDNAHVAELELERLRNELDHLTHAQVDELRRQSLDMAALLLAQQELLKKLSTKFEFGAPGSSAEMQGLISHHDKLIAHVLGKAGVAHG